MEVHHETNVVSKVPLWHRHAEPSLSPVGKKQNSVWRLWPTLLPPCRPSPLLLRHTPGRACKYQDPQAPAPISRRGWRSLRGSRGGQNCMCALPGPLSQCASEEQMSYCSSSSSPFMTTPLFLPTLLPLPLPPPATGGCRGGSSGGHLLILKIWTGISLLSKSVVIHLMGHCPRSPQTATPPLSSCSTSAQVDGPPRASPRNARI